MKKFLTAGIFSLLALAPLNCALAQTATDAQTVEKSSAAATPGTDVRKSGDPSKVTAKNHTTAGVGGDSTTTTSEATPKAVIEAQKNYDTGLGLYNSGKLTEAIDAFKESNKLKPNDPKPNTCWEWRTGKIRRTSRPLIRSSVL